MIEAVGIENFQSHKGTNIVLSPGVNVFKGRSHAGKSVIIRAIRWALLNQPRGTNFVSHFKKKKDTTSVGIEFSDGGHVVRQRRGTTVNGYESSVGDFEAMRSDVPDEIKTVTQMNAINVQMQGDPYFMLNMTPGKVMLNMTPGKVAKELNKLVGLDIIDHKLGRLNKLSSEAGAKVNVLEEMVENEKTELEELSFVNDLEVRVKEIETLWEQYNKTLARKAALSDMSEKLQELDSDIKEIDEWLTIKEPYDELRLLMEKHVSLLKSYENLKQLRNSLQKVEKAWQNANRLGENASKRLSELKKSKEYLTSFCKYCGAHKNHWRKD
jgi:exonuclease SbcC